MLLSLKQIFLEYSDRIILNNIDFNIDDNDKIALIGINGMGKSSLLKIVKNYLDLPSENYHAKNNLKIGYLDQETSYFETDDILAYVCSNKLNSENEYLAKSILNKLDINDYSLNLNNLSGGQKKRVALAKALVEKVDLLILDEPTNHLDLNMIEFLEGYLKQMRCALLMVTHDRYFLEAITNHIYELENGNIYQYKGNYTEFLSLKEQRLLSDEATYRKQISLLKKEKSWMLQGAKARGTKSKERIARFNELEKGLEKSEADNLSISSQASRMGQKILEITNLCVGYQDNVLLKDFNYTFKKHERLALIGSNGSGKTSLLRTLAQQIEPLSGEIDFGSTIKVGYFAQGNNDLNNEMRVIDYLQAIGEFIPSDNGLVSVTTLLDQFLFKGEKQYTLISKLSGGEKRRLYLLSILVSAPNFLILDEPTNDLDITTLAILEDYLTTFPGVVLLVSHDRYFMESVVDQYAHLENQKITITLDYTKPQVEVAETKEKKVFVKEKKVRLNYQEQKEFDVIDEEIETLESKISEYDQLINEHQDDYQKLNELMEQRTNLEHELELKVERWYYLNDKYELSLESR